MTYTKKMRKKTAAVMLLMIIVLIFPVRTFAAESDKEISLSGTWRMHEGDNAAFKNTGFNDSKWQIVPVPGNVRNKLANENEIIWYRTWIFIPPEYPNYNLGLRLGRIASADETFINGHLIGQSGTGESAKLQKIRIYFLPVKYLNPSGYNLIAVKVKASASTLAGIYSEQPRIGQYNALFFELIRAEGVNIVFCGIFVVIGSAFIFFFLRRSKDWALLYFGIGTLTMGIYTFVTSQWRFHFGLPTVYIEHFYFAVAVTMIPAFARFSYLHLAGKMLNKTKVQRFFDYASKVMIYTAVVVNVGIIIYPDYYFWDFFMRRINLYLCFIFSIIAIVHAMTKFIGANLEDKIVITVFIFSFMSGIMESLVLPLNLHVNFVMWGVMTLVLICTVILINRFFYLQDKVREYSVGLEKLVDVRTKQLKLMEESRRRLLANISHDLRTPVSSVLGHAELLLEDIIDSPEDQRIYIKRIHSKMLGFNRLIQDLFELAKIESQQERFQMSTVSVAEFMEEIYQRYVFDVENMGVRLENNTSLSPAIMVEADVQRLEQVFANLISNASRYVGDKGLIKISCQEIKSNAAEFTLKDAEKIVCFTVADNGSGIVTEYIPHVFERFNRGGESGTSPAEHSGLGLAISKEIIVAHGGRIWVDEKVSQGCTIHFILPELIIKN